MKRGTKTIVFIASMGLTIGSLVAMFGPCHYRHGSHDGYWNNNLNDKSCGSQNGWHQPTPQSAQETK